MSDILLEHDKFRGIPGCEVSDASVTPHNLKLVDASRLSALSVAPSMDIHSPRYDARRKPSQRFGIADGKSPCRDED